MRVGYLGPPGTFSEEAVRAQPLAAEAQMVPFTSIHHRDQARLYAKQVVDGRAQLELSPEEEEAMRVALAGEAPDSAERRR